MLHTDKFCEECGQQMTARLFTTEIVFYCKDCGTYTRNAVECEHEYMLVIFELDNGTRQLRNYCPYCNGRSQALKQCDYDLTNVPVKLESKYNEYKTRISDEPQKMEFIASLRKKQEQVYHAVYNQYIASEQWKQIRENVIVRDNGKCRICGKTADHVHHLTYAHFTREYPFELVSLCRECHFNEYHSEEVRKRIEELNVPKTA